MYTGGKYVEKKSIWRSLSTRPRKGNFRLTSRFGSMGWMMKAKVSKPLPGFETLFARAWVESLMQ